VPLLCKSVVSCVKESASLDHSLRDFTTCGNEVDAAECLARSLDILARRVPFKISRALHAVRLAPFALALRSVTTHSLCGSEWSPVLPYRRPPYFRNSLSRPSRYESRLVSHSHPLCRRIERSIAASRLRLRCSRGTARWRSCSSRGPSSNCRRRCCDGAPLSLVALNGT